MPTRKQAEKMGGIERAMNTHITCPCRECDSVFRFLHPSSVKEYGVSVSVGQVMKFLRHNEKPSQSDEEGGNGR